MGRKSTFTAAAKRDAVMGMLIKRKTVAQTCRELGISETTFARWREQALEGMAAALLDRDKRGARGHELAKQPGEAERTIGLLAPDSELLGKASRRLT